MTKKPEQSSSLSNLSAPQHTCKPSLARQYIVPGFGGPQTVTVALGDAVWFFHRGDMSATPAPAFVVELCDQGQAHLTVYDLSSNGWQPRRGACIIGDDRLENEHVKARGVWVPRLLIPATAE